MEDKLVHINRTSQSRTLHSDLDEEMCCDMLGNVTQNNVRGDKD